MTKLCSLLFDTNWKFSCNLSTFSKTCLFIVHEIIEHRYWFIGCNLYKLVLTIEVIIATAMMVFNSTIKWSIITIQLTNQGTLVDFRPVHYNKWQYRELQWISFMLINKPIHNMPYSHSMVDTFVIECSLNTIGSTSMPYALGSCSSITYIHALPGTCVESNSFSSLMSLKLCLHMSRMLLNSLLPTSRRALHQLHHQLCTCCMCINKSLNM